LTEAQKRRVAFIKGELNEGKKACNAYLVLEPLPADATMSMREVIDALVSNANGTTFEGFTIRADVVRPKSKAAIVATLPSTTSTSGSNGITPPSYTVPPSEARRTIFMGSLDFAESEENVRSETEKVLVRERGVSKDGKPYVEGVRLIRDPTTGLGKGFGYVLLRVRPSPILLVLELDMLMGAENRIRKA